MSTNTAPFTVQPRLTQIAMAIKPVGLIADEVCPRIPVPAEKFIYTKMNTEEGFTIPDVRVGRTGQPNRVEFGGVDVTDSTEDFGLDDSVPNKDILNAEGTNYDPLDAATDRTTILVRLAREQRVAALYFTLGNYPAAQRATLAGADQWSDPASDPLKAILDMFDTMLIRPNVGTFGRLTYSGLRRHPKIVAAVLNSGGVAGGAAAAGAVSKQALADLLELDEIHVGESFSNTAKKGQAPVYARLWGKHASFARIDKAVRDTRAALPTFGFTAQWGDVVAGTLEDNSIGLRGGQRVRVGEHVKELIAFPEVGCFFQNAVA